MSGTSSNAINDAIAAAKAKAAEHVAAAAEGVGAVATVQLGNTTVATAPGRGAPLSMDDMVGGGISVDNWIGVKEFGFVIGAAKTLVKGNLLVSIDLATVAPCYAIKFGNPSVYFKTYDRMTEARGGSWAEAVRKAQMANPNASEYRAVDIPMHLLRDITDEGKVLLEAGVSIGYSTSTTNWGAWESFYNTCKRAGVTGTTVKVQLGWEKKTNKANNIWGIITFTLVEEEG